MQKNFGQNDPAISTYVDELFHPEDSALRLAREASDAAGLPPIQVGPMDNRHLEVLARAFGAKRAVEIGTLAGYSAIALARGLNAGGKLFTCELDEKHAQVARQNFKNAGVADRVEVLEGPALSSLEKLNGKGPFDLVFIDADKVNYPNYLMWAVANLRSGGVILADNTFAWGKIAAANLPTTDPDVESVKALRDFNSTVANHPQLRATILPTGEGLTVAVKL